jgi:structural maintenance of chromosome 3 (chondroitin sulfate proteoglycan 6)
VIRRFVGPKKDEYFINKKHATKLEVTNVLEAAGFTRSNPLFMVQQGKIQELALMSDGQRLELLTEVAGTKLYDERRAESMKILGDCKGKKDQIDQLLTYISDRLGELEGEREELEEYNRLDKDRRAIEYTILSKEFESAATALENIDAQREEETKKAAQISSRQTEVYEKIVQAQQEHKQLESELAGAQREVDTDSRKADLESKSDLALKIAANKNNLAIATNKEKQLKKDLADAKRQSQTREAELAKVQPEYEKVATEEAKLKEAIESAQRRLNELYSKQNRKEQFKTKKERDTFLRGEIKKLEELLATKKPQVAELNKSVAGLDNKFQQNRDRIEALTNEVEALTKALEASKKIHAELKQERDTLQNTYKEQQIKANQLDTRVKTSRDNMFSFERRLQLTTDKMVSQALSAIRRISAERKINGVFGPLIELFECEDDFKTAVEVTAGAALFHVLVDTDDTAARLLKILNEEKLGRITFIPLNRVQAVNLNLPDTTDAHPLLRELRYEAKFKPAFSHLFGQTLVCRNLEVASKYSRESEFQCITLDGDQVSRRGALTGGFYNAKESRIDAMKGIKQWRSEYEKQHKELEQLKGTMQQLEQRINKVSLDMRTESEKLVKMEHDRDHKKLERAPLATEQIGMAEQLEQQEKLLASLQAHVQHTEETRQRYAEEMKGELTDKLSAGETKELKELVASATANEKLLVEVTRTKAALEQKKNDLQNQLVQNLSKRVEQLEEGVKELGEKTQEENLALENNTHELAIVEKALASSEQRFKELEVQMQQKRNALEAARKKIDSLKAEESNCERSLIEEANSMQQLLNRRMLQQAKKTECTKSLRDLGTLPAELLEKYQKSNAKKLNQDLQKLKSKLKDMNVNQKAWDQYSMFTERREKFVTRREELRQSEGAIENWIKVLDEQKNSAIARTFRGVMEQFQKYFAELTGGTATIEMNIEGGQLVNSDRLENRLHLLRGIALRVSFPGQAEGQLIEELSGGQRSLVALSFILAVQVVDRSPVYIFDEIDAALDDDYRGKVAQLLLRLTERADEEDSTTRSQFIISTFRPEFISVADKHYEVTFNGNTRSSTINPISAERSLEVLREESGERPKGQKKRVRQDQQ